MAKGNPSQAQAGRGGENKNPAKGGGPPPQRAGGPRSKKAAHHREEDESTGHLDDGHHTGHSTEPTPPTTVHEKREYPAPPKIQPTSEQMMIAQIIRDNADDIEAQKKKIQQVIDITGREEDEVATALFDAGWDQNRAIELLLEGGISAWEETGKKKKKKQPVEENKDDWDESGAHERGDRASRPKGPPRLRRGGPGGGRGGSRGGPGGGQGGPSGSSDFQSDSLEGGPAAAGSNFRGGRRGDQPPRRGGRGGRGGGGTGSGPSRNTFQANGQNGAGTGSGTASSATGTGFSGSIDTWNPSGGGGGGGGGGGSGGGSTSGAPAPTGPAKAGGTGGGGGSNKDAFDNAGNWGDDFPVAEDWVNEEYTGSLADTKVFTASSANAKGPSKRAPAASGQGPSAVGQSRSFSAALESSGSHPPAPSVTAPAPVGSGGSSYPQAIDLTTLLQKPTTQSSISSTQPSLLQYPHQPATDSLKAAVGIGSSQSGSGPDLNNYSSYQNPGGNNYAGASGSGSAFSSIKPASNGDLMSQQQRQPPPKGGPQGPGAARSRVPPPSKIPSSAVEMPGESLTRLDVQFGGMELQFGSGGNPGAQQAVNAASDAFEFNGSSLDESSKYLAGDKSAKGPHDYIGAPSAKEVNKTLSNAISGGKLNPSGESNVSAYASYGSSVNNYGSSQGGSYQYGGQGGLPSSTANYTTNGTSYASQATYSTQQQQQSSRDHGSNNYYGNSNQSAGGPSGGGSSYKNNVNNQYQDKMANEGPSSAQTSMAGSAALGLTTTTNALSSKVSATSASKVSMTNLPPGVAGMTMPPQYMIGNPNLPYFGLQQPTAAMFSPYAGLDDLAAMQHRNAASLHSLSNPGYFDPNAQYVGSSLTSNRSDNQGSNVGGNSNSNLSAFSDKAFGNVVAASDSTSSPIPSTHQSAVASQSAAVAAAQQQQSFGLATNAFAQGQTAALPPGYAYFYGQVPGLQATYGSGMYQPTGAPMAPVPTTTTQFQQKGFGSNNYSYDPLGQGNKDFSNAYGGANPSGGKGGNSGSGANNTGKNNQYWGNSNMSSSHLW
eukprot:maker-scaffold34_size539781-snap-gene-2.9 protein:Tk05358 transcript:maker-scaffold34_size539781-snap-gene-2.9-mRNA-1 annotation:"protein lingerer-like"